LPPETRAYKQADPESCERIRVPYNIDFGSRARLCAELITDY